MFKIEKIGNPKIWDKIIENQIDFPFFQNLNWLKLQEKLGNKVFKFEAFENKKLLALFGLVEINAKRGKYLYLRQGPVFNNNLDSKIFKEIINFSKNLARKEKADFLRVGRFPENAEDLKILKTSGFIKSNYQNAEAQVCWVLDLNKNEDELLKNMRKSHRYLIKKSLNSSLKLIKTKKVKDLDLFLPLYKNLSLRKHFIAHKGIKEEFEIFSRNNEEILLLVKFENKIIAGAIIAFMGNMAIYRHSAIDEDFKNIPASYLIQWEAIKEAKKRNKKIYNFWGISPNENDKKHPWYGLSLFKIGFGGRKIYYLPVMDLPLKLNYVKNYLIDWINTKKYLI